MRQLLNQRQAPFSLFRIKPIFEFLRATGGNVVKMPLTGQFHVSASWYFTNNNIAGEFQASLNVGILWRHYRSPVNIVCIADYVIDMTIWLSATCHRSPLMQMILDAHRYALMLCFMSYASSAPLSAQDNQELHMAYLPLNNRHLDVCICAAPCTNQLPCAASRWCDLSISW